MNSIFEYNDHYNYLKDWLKNTRVKAIKGRFAEHTLIQPAFLSQVLAQKYPLSLEQADLANTFLDHTIEESDFFLLLVGHDRAGSASLKKYYSKQIEKIRKHRLEVIERLGKKIELPALTQGIYYSSWLYSAIHIALTIPSLKKINQLKDYFGIEREKILQILQFLETHQLAVRINDEFHATQNWMRLDRVSPHIVKLHTNWRNKAIESLDFEKESDFHFSGVYSLDEKTAKIIKDALLENLSRQIKKIEDAPEKEIYILNMDFFNLKK